MDGWNTTFLLGRPIFRGYVSFREGSLGPQMHQARCYFFSTKRAKKIRCSFPTIKSFWVNHDIRWCYPKMMPMIRLCKLFGYITHTIHVWYIYLHLVDFYGKCRQIYHTWMAWVIAQVMFVILRDHEITIQRELLKRFRALTSSTKIGIHFLTWPMAKLEKLFGITYLVGKLKFKLFFFRVQDGWVSFFSWIYPGSRARVQRQNLSDRVVSSFFFCRQKIGSPNGAIL